MKPSKPALGPAGTPPNAELRFAPDQDASLEEITNALASLRAATDPDLLARRAELVDDLDVRGRERARSLTETMDAATPKTADQRRVWSSLGNFWREDALALTGVLKEYFVGAKGFQRLTRSLDERIVRTIRSFGTLVRVLSLRYAPLRDELWKEVGFVYALAEQRSIAETEVTVDGRATTAQKEFLRLVMFASGAPENLTPSQQELADRIAAASVGGFDVSSQPRLGSIYWIDLATSRGPQRYIKSVEGSPTMRFFTAMRALESVDLAIGSALVNGALPQSFAELPRSDPNEILTVLRHLRGHWSTRLPARRHKRVPVHSEIKVAWGLDSILDLLDPPRRQFLIDMATGAPLATWTTEDVSHSGLSARAPQADDEWLAIGTLVAMQVSKRAAWQLGVVQRLRRTPSGDILVGIEMLSRAPRAVTAVPDRLGPGASESAIILSELKGGTEAGMLISPGRHVPTTAFFVRAGNKSYRLDQEQVVRSGADYELVNCRVTLRQVSWERVE
jgi:hypothetical protein